MQRPSVATNSDLEQRLLDLHKKCRLLERLLFAGLLLTVANCASAALGPARREVVARSFVLVDEQGRALGRWEGKADGSTNLRMENVEGTASAVLAVGPLYLGNDRTYTSSGLALEVGSEDESTSRTFLGNLDDRVWWESELSTAETNVFCSLQGVDGGIGMTLHSTSDQAVGCETSWRAGEEGAQLELSSDAGHEASLSSDGRGSQLKLSTFDGEHGGLQLDYGDETFGIEAYGRGGHPRHVWPD